MEESDLAEYSLDELKDYCTELGLRVATSCTEASLIKIILRKQKQNADEKEQDRLDRLELEKAKIASAEKERLDRIELEKVKIASEEKVKLKEIELRGQQSRSGVQNVHNGQRDYSKLVTKFEESKTTIDVYLEH